MAVSRSEVSPPEVSRAARSEALAQALALFLSLLILPGALRGWLLWSSRAELGGVGSGALLHALWMGLRLDGVIAAILAFPAALLLFLPAGARRRAIGVWSGICLVFMALALCAELVFFRYYGFRANYLVLEHGADPEVLRTVALGYLTPALGLEMLGALAAAFALQRALRTGLAQFLPALGGWRERLAAPALIALFGLVARGTLDHRPLNPGAAVIGSHRLLNEITASGVFNVTYEMEQALAGARVALSRVQHLMPQAAARERARRLFAASGALGVDPVNPYARRVSAPLPPGRPRNVVVVVMESFTGRLIGAMGGELALSPEFDALSREGLLLTHCYATGERTVQGLEAVLSSFPPLPGVSVVRRPESQTGFATLASLLGARGYDTLFLYGGQGIFDNMRSFFLGNGFRAFIEERDFPDPAFRGSWGVSDGDVFHRANREFQQRWEAGRPFLGAILTVSLHSPWEFPRGGVPELPPGTPVPEGFERDELANFLYADYALGEFVREARGLPYFADTVFVFVGDHGVHLRGRELLPSEEYRVASLILAPGLLQPGRLEGVTSQLDLAPTILGLVGGEFVSPFFGADVRTRDAQDALAILVYDKRHYGARRADRLTVLSARGGRTAYRVEGGQLSPSALEPAHQADADDALALLQVAEELLERRQYSVPEAPAGARQARD